MINTIQDHALQSPHTSKSSVQKPVTRGIFLLPRSSSTTVTPEGLLRFLKMQPPIDSAHGQSILRLAQLWRSNRAEESVVRAAMQELAIDQNSKPKLFWMYGR